MLVLSRKLGESIVIGHNITVKVNRIHGNRVALGIEAPADIVVLRGELEPIADSSANARIGAKTPSSVGIAPNDPVQAPDFPMGSVS